MLTRELSLEIVAGDEKLASLLVEARIELLRQLTLDPTRDYQRQSA